MLTLPTHSAHLWCLDLDREPRAIAMLKDAHVGWLSERERQRFRRLQLPQRRQHYLLGKVFTRQVLSRYSQTAPDAWQFAENAHGKPFIMNAEGVEGVEGVERAKGAEGSESAANASRGEQSPPLYFNLSHSRERFVLVVSRVAASGVDVEYCARKRRVSRLAQRYFTAAECAWLLGLPLVEQQAAFYQLWTLKEAFMKARGLGQALALDAFSFDLSSPGRIAFSPDRNARAESGVADANWRCWRLADPLASAALPDANEAQYALALVFGLKAGIARESAMSLSTYRYDVTGDDQHLTTRILAANE